MNQIDDFNRRGAVSRYDGKLWVLGIVIMFLSIIPFILGLLQKIDEKIGAIIFGVFLIVGLIIAASDADNRIIG